jgi:two-component system, response regulator PdtaR
VNGVSSILRVAIADDEDEIRAVLGRMLRALGYDVAAMARTGRELVERCVALRPDLVIADVVMPELDGFGAAAQIAERAPAPVILIAAHCDDELVDRAVEAQVMAYLVKPITEGQLSPAIALATSRYEELEAVQQESADLRQALADRKIIEKAKGVLMRHLAADEATAFRRLQSLSSTKHLKLVDMAEAILDAVRVLDD